MLLNEQTKDINSTLGEVKLYIQDYLLNGYRQVENYLISLTILQEFNTYVISKKVLLD